MPSATTTCSSAWSYGASSKMPVSVAPRRASASSSTASRISANSLYQSSPSYSISSRYSSTLSRTSVAGLDFSTRLTSPSRTVRHNSVTDESSVLSSRYSSSSRERSTEPTRTETRTARETSKSSLSSSSSSALWQSSYSSSSKLGRPPLHSAVSSSTTSEDGVRSTPSYARSRSISSTGASMTTSTGKPFHSRFLKPKPPPEEKNEKDSSGSDKESREDDDDSRNNNNNNRSHTDNNGVNSHPRGEVEEDDDDNGNDRRRPSVAALRQKFDATVISSSSSLPSLDSKPQRTADDAGPISASAGSAPESQPAPLAGGHEDSSSRQQRLSEVAGNPISSSPAPSASSDSDNYDSPRLSRRAGSSSLMTNGSTRGSGLNGLRNIGNTCFMNSVIQCLSNTRPLLEYLLKQNYLSEINTTNSSMKGALIKAFSKMIEELWTGEGQVVNTSAFKGQIQHFAPRFMGYSQQDAQEFLRYLLEGLHEDVNRVEHRPTNTALPDIEDTLTDNQKADESWRRYLRLDDSSVLDVFVGQLKSTLQCTVCGHCSVTFDPFWDLSLPIPSRTGQLRLQQCLEHFTREEVLDGDEKPTCSKCQTRRKCTKSFSIQKFPKILVLHLKRFSPMERFRGKLNVTVEFPLTGLDLSAYAANRGRGCTYNLYGIANHSGTTYSGHYTAYCKHPYTHDWHEYNDSRVSTISSRNVVSGEAYVLFYELSGHTSHL